VVGLGDMSEISQSLFGQSDGMPVSLNWPSPMANLRTFSDALLTSCVYMQYLRIWTSRQAPMPEVDLADLTPNLASDVGIVRDGGSRLVSTVGWTGLDAYSDLVVR
jgi:hypothetical protein